MTALEDAPDRGLPTGQRRPALTSVDHVLLLSCLALAAVFRLHDLRQPLVDAFSWREASTAMIADNFRTGSWNIFFPEVSWTGPGPSYQGREFQVVSYITAILHALFGWHDWLGRLVAVAFGVWTVFALHRLTAAVWGTGEAHFVALAYAIMPGAIVIDRSFLPDPAMLALVTTGVWLFVRYLQEGRMLLLPASGVFLTLGILAKLPGIAAGAPFAYIALVWILRGKVRQAVPIVVVGIATLATVACYYAWAIHLGNSYPPYHVAGHGYIWQEGARAFVEQRFFVQWAWWHFVWWYLGWPLIFLALVGMLSPPPRVRGGEGALAWIIHAWLAAAVLVYLAAAQEVVTNPWNFHVFSAPLAAFAGRGLSLIATADPGQVRHPWTPLRFFAIAGFAVALGTLPLVEAVKEEPRRVMDLHLGQRLQELSAPGDLVIAVASEVGNPVAIYYSRRRGWVFPPGGGNVNWTIFVEHDQAVKQLEDLRTRGAAWFGVTRNATDSWGRLFVEHHAELLAYLEATAERVADTDEMIIFRIASD